MKHHYLTRFRVSSFLFLLFCLSLGSGTQLYAQVFTAPIGFEDSWPAAGSPNINITTHTSAYSFANVSITGVGMCDVAFAGWDEPSGTVGGVSWRYLMPGNPAVVINQGIIPYANARDLEVGYLDVGGSQQLLVAYYSIGVGHMLDVYDLNAGGATLLYTNALSAAPNYGRISMDCHLQYATAITWEETGVIYTMVGLNTSPVITFSGVLTIGGTQRDFDPDCAFSHTGMAGTLNVHYCYYSPATGLVTESSYDFWTMITMGGGTVPVAVNDLNFVGFLSDPLITNIDCPGHYDVENWAYAYTTNNADISVRLVDYHTTGIPITRVVNDMSTLPCKPINMYRNLSPFPAYDPNHTPGLVNIYVGWWTGAPDPMAGFNPAGYVALRMNEFGNAVISPIDYLTVANNPTWASQTPVLSFSKQDDMFPFLYTVFPEWDPFFPGYRLQNKYHNWATPQFKGEEEHEHEVECNDEARIAEFKKKLLASTTIKAYPNPFTNVLGLSFPASMQQSATSVVVSDMTGKVIDTYNGQVSKVNSHLTDLSKTLSPGAYIMNVSVDGQTKQAIKVTKVQ
ncbi:MAG: T9SS type A sorting domain-containing protein [Chitinophagales bacterium]|nr:T9SS type A sorting domain-containing protein [Chitinophagales bacterium]